MTISEQMKTNYSGVFLSLYTNYALGWKASLSAIEHNKYKLSPPSTLIQITLVVFLVRCFHVLVGSSAIYVTKNSNTELSFPRIPFIVVVSRHEISSKVQFFRASSEKVATSCIIPCKYLLSLKNLIGNDGEIWYGIPLEY